MTRILVADDEAQVRETLVTLLEDAGFETVVARGGLQAIEAAETRHVDIAFVDLLMPDVDGLEAVKAIGRLRPRIPVVAMSGRMLRPPCEEFDSLRLLATRLGADYCLAKPFSFEDVEAAVRHCLVFVRGPRSV